MYACENACVYDCMCMNLCVCVCVCVPPCLLRLQDIQQQLFDVAGGHLVDVLGGHVPCSDLQLVLHGLDDPTDARNTHSYDHEGFI